MGLIKIFSGSEILAKSLQEKIEAIGVNTTIRNNNQITNSITMAKPKPIELFIQETDFSKANPIIEEFRLSI
jgi:hypothetical protein